MYPRGALAVAGEVLQTGAPVTGGNTALLAQQSRTPEEKDFLPVVNAPVNALYHQKILTEYVLALSPILTDIVTEGIAQKRFRVSFPRETVEILPGAGLVIFDEAYFRWTAKERLKRAATFIRAAELLLSTRPGNFAALAGIPETG